MPHDSIALTLNAAAGIGQWRHTIVSLAGAGNVVLGTGDLTSLIVEA